MSALFTLAKTPLISFKLIIVSMLMLSGCTSSSHVLLGATRPALSIGQVIIYSKPPANYEKIAILHSSSRNSWRFSEQGKMDQALLRLKEEAAALGANGILIEATGDEHSGYISTGSGNYSSGSSFGVSVGMPLMHKTAQGVAIWVEKNTKQPTIKN